MHGAYPVLGDPTASAVLEAISEWAGHTPTQCVLSPEMELVLMIDPPLPNSFIAATAALVTKNVPRA